MNQKLNDLYKTQWRGLTNEIKNINEKSAQPLLLKVSDDYINADKKVMFIGQETNGWGKCFNTVQNTVDELMDMYESYFYTERKTNGKCPKRPFWNKRNYQFFEDELKKHFTKKHQSVELVWNNISKLGNHGHGKGKPHEKIKNVEREYFRVIESEVSILKPDIIIFTTGSRDSFIKYHFGDNTKFVAKLGFEGKKPEELTKNLLAEVLLGKFKEITAIRIQHPGRRAIHNSVVFSALKTLLN